MLRVAINGYGNLGRGVEQAITKNADMEVAGPPALPTIVVRSAGLP